MHRHELSDQEWSRLEPLLPAEKGRPGRPVTLSNRVFLNAIFYIAKTGVPWRDLPERFGPWKTVTRGSPAGIRVGVFQTDPGGVRQGRRPRVKHGRWLVCESPPGLGGWKRGAQIQGIGRSRGGLTTKIHALVDGLGNPLHLHLTAGNIHDVSEAAKLVEKAQGLNFIADKGYDANHVIEAIEKKQMTAVIPSKSNRKLKRRHRRTHLQGASSRGELLLQDQAVPTRRHPL